MTLRAVVTKTVLFNAPDDHHSVWPDPIPPTLTIYRYSASILRKYGFTHILMCLADCPKQYMVVLEVSGNRVLTLRRRGQTL